LRVHLVDSRTWAGPHAFDLTTLVEIGTPQGLFPLAHAIRDADIRDVVDLTPSFAR
jgi:hypothetical protein